MKMVAECLKTISYVNECKYQVHEQETSWESSKDNVIIATEEPIKVTW